MAIELPAITPVEHYHVASLGQTFGSRSLAIAAIARDMLYNELGCGSASSNTVACQLSRSEDNDEVFSTIADHAGELFDILTNYMDMMAQAAELAADE
jgi:hypothetical protein